MEQEDYLETLYHLKKQKGHIRVSDIADELNISKPSVTQMMQRLSRQGYVHYEPYLPVKLSEKGQKIGKDVAERHKVLADFFTLLGIAPHVQEKDIHGIEHSLSPVTLQKLKKLNRFLEKKKFHL